MRFVFAPPADHAAGLLTLPWTQPLADWRDKRLVEVRQQGIARHVVRFVYDAGTLYALKELSERLAQREYRLLRAMADLNIPAVEAVGIAVDRGGADSGPPDDAILVTKFLRYATTYRAVFSHPLGVQPLDGLLDALVELLVRLHLSGFFWGDGSLSNTLFRHDAGTLEAYLVDAETSEQHPALTAGQRRYDVELALERVFGELLDLQAGELLPADLDPAEIAEDLRRRYESLWQELTREEVLHPDKQQSEIAERLHRLNELGFDVAEVELIPTGEGNKLRLRTRVAESGHNTRQLFLRTGIDAAENQARQAAQRHSRVPHLAGAEAGPPGLRGRGGQPVAGGGLQPGDRRGPGGSPGPAAAGRDLLRGAGTPLVHVRDRGPGRRHHGRRPGLHQARAASSAATTRRGDRRAGEMTPPRSGGRSKSRKPHDAQSPSPMSGSKSPARPAARSAPRRSQARPGRSGAPA